MRIMSNIPALQSYNALTATNSALSKSIERLSTGLRINSAADDAAGLAISEKMRAQIKGLTQATSNAQDGISMIQTAEGALSETHSILQRMRELSVQAANDTLTQEDRSYIQLEIDQLKEEITRISTTTQFNKKKLLDGSAAVLWSSDNLETKAIVHGGLRSVDQFGQKTAVEGNFRIAINASPGSAEVQKSDIFKIKHSNVVMNLQLDQNAGFQKMTIDNIPAGTYHIMQTTSTLTLTDNSYTSYRALGPVGFTDLNSYGMTPSTAYVSSHTSIVLQLSALTESVYVDGKLITAGAGAAGRITVAINSGYATTAAALAAALSKVTIQLASGTLVSSNYSTDGVKVQSYYGMNSATLVFDAASFGNGAGYNMSMLLEVVNINTGNNAVTFRVQVNALDANGNTFSFSDENFMVTTAGIAAGESQFGLYFLSEDAVMLDKATIDQLQKGSKMVVSILSTKTAATNSIVISGTVNRDWPQGWTNGADTAVVEVAYNVDAASLKGKDVHFKNFYLNTANGTVYEGDIRISFNNSITSATASYIRASFEAAYVGQVAKGDVKLRDIDKFWDSNGKFLLDDAQTLTMYQGDGTNTSVTLYSTDTLDDVRKKLNDAVAFGLGQAKYVSEASNNFVSFVEDPVPNSDESVAGTFVIRSLIPGSAGKLSFSGDEDIIKAFSLNVIQDASENTFRVSVFDAHSGGMVATDMKISGNVLYGVVNPNVDVEFDPMANINATWNEITKSFVLSKNTTSYETILHLADNSTVFQVGANEGEDMSIDMGDMSAHALGVDKIVVTDRESAARSITAIDTAIGRVSRQRAKLGAYQNRLEHTINNLTTAATNTTSAESRIRDADMAKEMMEFTKLNILSQAGNSMLAQANQLPQNVLQLLRG